MLKISAVANTVDLPKRLVNIATTQTELSNACDETVKGSHVHAGCCP